MVLKTVFFKKSATRFQEFFLLKINYCIINIKIDHPLRLLSNVSINFTIKMNSFKVKST